MGESVNTVSCNDYRRYAEEIALKWQGQIDWRLNYLVDLAPVLRLLTAEDLGIAVADKEKFLIYLAGNKLNLKIQSGDLIPPQLPIKTSMKEGRRIIKTVGKEAYGTPYIAISVPIFGDEGKVIGGIAVQQSTEQKENLIKISQQISEALSVLASTVQEISAEGETLSATSQELAAIAQASEDGIKKTDMVVDIIGDISNKSKLLGINSAIEAARAGSEGRGFAIVAQEIRKLVEQSAKSITEIKVIMEEFSESIKQINVSAAELGTLAGNQTNHLERFTNAIEDLSLLSKNLVNMAEQLTKEN